MACAPARAAVHCYIRINGALSARTRTARGAVLIRQGARVTVKWFHNSSFIRPYNHLICSSNFLLFLLLFLLSSLVYFLPPNLLTFFSTAKVIYTCFQTFKQDSNEQNKCENLSLLHPLTNPHPEVSTVWFIYFHKFFYVFSNNSMYSLVVLNIFKVSHCTYCAYCFPT